MEGKDILVTHSLTFPSLHLSVDLYTFVMTHERSLKWSDGFVHDQWKEASTIPNNHPTRIQFTSSPYWSILKKYQRPCMLHGYLHASSYLVKVTCESQEDETGVPLENVVWQKIGSCLKLRRKNSRSLGYWKFITIVYSENIYQICMIYAHYFIALFKIVLCKWPF